MNHCFPSRRSELASVTEALAVLSDLLTVDAMTCDDATHVLQRCDELVSDPTVKSALARRASDLGLLPRKLVAASDATVEWDALERAWWERIRSADPLATKHRKALESLRATLTATRDEITAVEGVDAGASSPSDYSDSDTRSTASTKHSTSDDESEGEEEEDDENED